MVDCLIFTKDRACQLELLLRTVTKRVRNLSEVTIIYKASDDFFLDGYKKLIEWYPDIKWIPEKNLVEQIRYTIFNFKSNFFVTFVDDEVVVRDIDFAGPVESLNQLEHVHCVSLRMGSNVTHCYTANLPSPIPPHEKLHGCILWKWSGADPRVDWGYPSCINSHVYRKNEFVNILERFAFKDVNSLEGTYNLFRSNFKPFMICYNEPVTINVANNIVQSGTNRHGTNQEFSLSSLNRKFLSGQRISEKNLVGLEINMATFEANYEFEQWELYR